MTAVPAPFPPRSHAIYALAMLMMAAFFSFLDRQILTLLVQPIKLDLGVSDTQIGLLQGLSFAVFFSVLALPFGWAVDRFNRIRIVAAGIATWSLATVYCGFSHSFGELLVARMLVGVGEATLMPAAYSLLADYYPPQQRGRAFGVFMMSVFVGGGGALLFGGLILHALGGVDTVVLPVLGAMPLWKAAFVVVGLPGLLVAALMLTVREPLRRLYGLASDVGSARTLISYIREYPAAFLCVWTVYSLLGVVAYGVIPWGPTLLVRKFGLGLPMAGLFVGGLALAAGVIGAGLSGYLADRWTSRGARGAKFRLTLVFWLGAVPALALFTLASDLRLALVGYGLFSLVNTIGYVSASAVIQDMVPGHLRGRTTAFWYLVTGVIGNGMGPLITALITDKVFHSDAALPYSILLMAAPSVLIGLLVSLRGLKPYDAARRGLAE